MLAGIPTRTTIEAAPFGFWRGWITSLLVGIVLSAYLGGAVTYLTVILEVPNKLGALWQVPFWPVMALPLSLIVVVVLGTVPISLAYVMLRWLARHASLRAWQRITFGLMMGSACNAAVWLSLASRGLMEARVAYAPFNSFYFPFAEIEVAAVGVSLALRRRWLGVPRRG